MKFLRGKVLRIVLAVCMLTALLCITASAVDNPGTASATIAGTPYEVIEGEGSLYFTTDKDGNVSLCEDEGHASCTHTIEFVYPEDGIPTIYLRGAYITYGNGNYSIQSNDNTAELTQIVVEAVDGAVQVGETARDDVDTYLGKGISWAGGELVVQGDGKLWIETPSHGFVSEGYPITIQNLDLYIETTGSNTSCLKSATATITFDGCNAELVAVYPVYYPQNATTGDLVIKNGADVSMISNNNTIYTASATNAGNIVVENSKLSVATNDSSRYAMQLNASAKIQIKNSTATFSSPGAVTNLTATALEMTEYPNAYYAVYSRSDATGQTGITTYTDGTGMNNYKYLKIEPYYTITVESGTASVGGETVEKATANTTVTLTADPAQGNQAFAGWEVVSGPAGFTIANASAEEVTFKMPAGNVSVKATYGNAATVKIGNANFTAVESGQTHYLKTDNAGNVTNNGDKNNYNIKFEYPTGGTPTISLRDAYITSTGSYAIESVSNSADKVIIVVEKVDNPSEKNGEQVDSYLGKGISWSHGALEIQGSETSRAIEELGKLKIATSGYAINMSLQPITFKNLNLDVYASTAGSNGRVFAGTPTLVTFDGGNAVLKSAYVVYYPSSSGVVGGIQVTNNAIVEMESVNKTVYAPNCPNVKFTVDSGKLTMNATGEYAMQAPTGCIVINGGTVEMRGSSNLVAGGVGAPDLNGYLNASGDKNYHAVYSTQYNPSEANLVSYTEGSNLSGKYFKLEPAYKVMVDGEVVRAKVTVDTEVTITASPGAGKAFDGWTLVSGPTGFAIETPGEDEVTFNMPAGNVSVTATYVNQATIRFNAGINKDAGKEYTFKGSETVFLKTNAAGQITDEVATENDYHIKLAFEGDMPTMWLQNATISDTCYAVIIGENTPQFTIKTVAKSTIQQTQDEYDHNASTGNSTRAAITFYGKLIFQNNALLNVTGANNAVRSSDANAEILFDHANVNLKTTGGRWGEAVFAGSIQKIDVDGGTLAANADKYMIIWRTTSGTITFNVRDNANVTLTANEMITYNRAAAFNVINGYLYAEGKKNDVIFNNSTITVSEEGRLEAKNAGSGTILANEPGLFDGSYAVMGASKETATKYESGALSNKYFRVGKKATVTVTDGTAQAFDDQSTENEGIHTLETMVGAEVTVTAKSAAPGHAFAEWEVTGLDNIDLNNDSIVFLMPAGDVSATATYGQTAEVNIGGTLYVAVEGGKTHYLKTDNVGGVTDDGDENVYNIMFKYPTEGTPTISLRDAYINTESYAIQSVATAADKVIIVVEKVDNPSEKNGEQVDSYLGKGIHWSHSALEIQGSDTPKAIEELGKLKIATSGHAIDMSSQPITFKNLNLDISLLTGGNYRVFTGTPTLVTFDGGKADLYSPYVVYFVTDAEAELQGIQVTNNADVTMKSSNKTIYSENPYAKLVVDSGNLTVTSDANNAIQLNSSKIEITGGIVAFSSPTAVETLGYVPTLTYDESDGKTYYASVSKNEDGTNASEYNGTSGLSNYKYFKVRPGYWITVEGGTPNRLRAPANETFTVNLTPGNALNAGEGFKYWTSEAWDEGVKVQGSSYEFLMPNEPITIVANWGDLAQVQMNASTSVSVVEGGATHYYTVADNVITAGDEDNYNIMFAYTEGGTPTLTLKGVTLTSGGRIHCGADTPELIVEVQGVNKLTYTGGSTVAFAGNNLTFTGGGTLELKTGVVGISMTNEGLNAGLVGTALKFDDVNVSVQTTGAYQMCINPAGSDIVVDGGVLTMVSSGKANSGAGIYTTNANGTLTVTGDAIVTVTDVSNGIRIGNITMESGIVTIGKEGAPEGTGLYLNNASGWVITGGTMEIFAGSVCERTPGLNGYTSEYLAVACTSKADYKANPYNYDYVPGAELKYTNYFLIQPKEARVQITWAPMTFTYQGAEWNVDTLQWEGIWVATEVDGWYTNQIIVENTGTEDVTVSFDFAKEEPQMTSSPVEGKFVSSNDKETAESVGTTTLRRCASVTAFLSLESKAVNPFEGSPTLGTVVVTITAETDVQIDEVEPVQDGGNAE